MKLLQRLYLLFFAVILFLIIEGTTAYVFSRHLGNDLKKIGSTLIPNLIHAKELETTILRIVTSTSEASLQNYLGIHEDSHVQVAEAAHIRSSRKEFERIISSLKRSKKSSELDEIQHQFLEIVKLSEEILNKSKQGLPQQELTVLKHDFELAESSILNLIQTLTSNYIAEHRLHFVHTKYSHNINTRFILLFNILAVIFIVSSMLKIKRSFLTPINALNSAINNVVESGNLDQEIPYDSPDELGELVGLFNKMIQERSKILKELEHYQHILRKKYVKTEAKLEKSLGEFQVLSKDFQLFLKDAAIPIFAVDVNHKITIWNKEIGRISKIGPEEAVGQFVDDLVQIEKNAKPSSIIRDQKAQENYMATIKENKDLVLQISYFIRHDHEELGTRAIFICTDLTGIYLSKKEIQILTSKILQIQESERRNLSMELHDNLAQFLGYAKLDLEKIDPNLETAILKTKLRTVSENIGKALEQIRDMSYLLRPYLLDQMGIDAAIRELCRDFSKKLGFQIEFQSTGQKSEVSSEVRIYIYRIIQECLNNIRKHADATKASVKIVSSYPHLILIIEDNGVGFNMEELKKGKFMRQNQMGLFSIRERVALLQGEVQFLEPPIGGTRIHVTIPFKENTSDE